MIANPEKFHAMLSRKDQAKLLVENLNIKGEQVKLEEAVKLLGIYLDHMLNFESTPLKFVEKLHHNLTF